MLRPLASLLTLALAFSLAQIPRAHTQRSPAVSTRVHDVSSSKRYGTHFETSDRCIGCHNGMTTSTGEDLSIGVAWRTSMMANAGRDPYWMAGVRREMMDHPAAAAAIQDECSICHMPMMRYEAKLAGGEGSVFAHLPPNRSRLSDRLAEDGVSCTVCHQIAEQGLGSTESFVGGFKIDNKVPVGKRPVYGKYEVDKGRTTIMHSSSNFRPTEGGHIRSSELCATCHTLITRVLDRQGNVIGELPEQVPYQEWVHSAYKQTKSCQACHMPVVDEEVPISSVFGERRQGVSRHTFIGGNFFMQRLLSRHRVDLAVTAEPHEMDAAANRTIAHLQNDAATVSVRGITSSGGRLTVRIAVENLGGHKLPTAYPSRRVWIHVTVRASDGAVVFESGALKPDGAIQGNDNDEDPARFEPHYTEITRPDQTQIYESVMAGADGSLTTGLLTAVRYVKDNRLLPRGFDKRTADKNVAVHGEAEDDVDFLGGGDEIRYVVPVGNAREPFRVEVALWYQPIAYRWAMNLEGYASIETKRFVGYYREAAGGSGVVLARAASVHD